MRQPDPRSCRARAGVLAGLFLAFAALAQSGSNPWAGGRAEKAAVEQHLRARERDLLRRERLQPRADAHPDNPDPSPTGLLPRNESPCFLIQALQLRGDEDGRFAWLLQEADGRSRLPQADPATGRCLGARGIQVVIDRLQHAVLSQGLVTTRVLAGPQDLQAGTLVLTVLPGRIEDIRWAEGTGARGSRWNTVPASPGQLLDLRDIEQALENFQRVPTAEAEIQVAPGREPGTSQLVIAHRQGLPFRLSATVDDGGTRSTGRYQGSLTLSYDNPLNLSDLFYLTLLRDLGGREPGERGTGGHAAHYSIPWGYGLLAFSGSVNRFRQAVAGPNHDPVYSGSATQAEARLSRLVQRDALGKTHASFKTFRRASRNFTDGTELGSQRRVVGALEAGLEHRRAWGRGSLHAGAVLRRGTGAWGSRRPPEEAFGESTSRMRLWLLEAGVQQAFPLGGRRWTYGGSWRAQYDRTPLPPQDRFAIGGRHTVRGFDGRSVLLAERGWLLRNDWSTAVGAGHQAYLGLDLGHVGGPSAATLVGSDLAGVVLGLRGAWGALQYDAFIGTPLHKPPEFSASPAAAGFSLAWSH